MKAGRFWAVFLAAFVSDLATKEWAVREKVRLARDPIEVIDGLLEFTYVTNPGAAWSMFSDYPQILTALAGLALVGVFFFRRQLELDSRSPQVIFGIISGGISVGLHARGSGFPRHYRRVACPRISCSRHFCRVACRGSHFCEFL